MISDKHVKSLIKDEYKPKYVKSQLTNIVLYDIETFNTDKAIPYANCIYGLSKNSGIYIRDITDREYEICRKDCIVFKGTENYNEMLDHVLQVKEKPEKVNNIISKFNILKLANKVSGFDSFLALNNLPQRRTVVSSIQNGSGILSRKISNGYVNQNKKVPQYVHFRYSRVHNNNFLKKNRL